MAQIIKRGLLQSFDASTYTASVLILEATSFSVSGIPVSTSVLASTAIAGAFCAVLFFDETNSNDAVVLACYPNGSNGVPSGSISGTITFVTPAAGNSNFLVNAGNTTTINLFGNGIPNGAKAVLVQVFFTSPTANSRIYLAPHNGTLADYIVLGNLYAANATIFTTGILPLDVNGQADVNANGGNCTITVITYGYVS